MALRARFTPKGTAQKHCRERERESLADPCQLSDGRWITGLETDGKAGGNWGVGEFFVPPRGCGISLPGIELGAVGNSQKEE